MAWSAKKENNYKILSTITALTTVDGTGATAALSSDTISEDVCGKKLTVAVQVTTGIIKSSAVAVVELMGSLDGTNWAALAALGNMPSGAASSADVATSAFACDLSAIFVPYLKIVYNYTLVDVCTSASAEAAIKFHVSIPV